MSYYAAIEAGGTKFVCAISKIDQYNTLIERISIPTTSPTETLKNIFDFFAPYHTNIIGCTIGCFGPIDLNVHSKTYGYILNTNKTLWQHFDLLGAFRQYLQPTCDIHFDTDVNIAAYGEYHHAPKTSAPPLESLLYITIGTGIGAGLIIHDKPVHGLTHPEMGHILIQPSPLEPSDFQSICHFHTNCAEGYASGPAINHRWGVQSCSSLPKDHLAWSLQSQYLAQILHNYIMVCSPQKIILGGGVMKQTQLFAMTYKNLLNSIHKYICHPQLDTHIHKYISPPVLGENSAIIGALTMAKNKCKSNKA